MPQTLGRTLPPPLETVLTKDYDIKAEIGRGAFSTVYSAVHKETKEEFAVKVVSKKLIGLEEAKDFQKRLDREVAILKTVSHPHIIPLHQIIESEKNLYLIMELVSGGELFDRIVEKGFYTEKEAQGVVSNISQALEYLHSINIAHRDLKPENLLLKVGEDTHVMISDFGLSRVLGEHSMAFTACGTPYYVAPEVVTASGYGVEVDLWSLGVITYFLLAGFPPFMAESLPHIVEMIINAQYSFPAPYWDGISADARDFISGLLTVDPKKRLTARQALKHPWLTSTTVGETPISVQSLQQNNSKIKKERQNSSSNLQAPK